MQYAPAVTDRSAEIYAQGANNATNIHAQGQANFQNSLTSSFNTVMGIVSKRVEQNNEDNAKMQQSMATGEAMMSLADNYGEQGQKFKTSLSKALEDTKGNPDKMSGAVMAHTTYFDTMMSKDKMQYQYDQSLNLAKQKQALGYGSAGSNPSLGVEVADGIDLGW